MPKNAFRAAATGLPKSSSAPRRRARPDSPQSAASDAPKPLDRLDDLPEVYGMTVAGDCLAPSIPRGVTAVVSRTEAPKVGDFVIIWFRPEFVKEGPQGKIKRLVMAAPPYVKSFPYNEHPKSEVAALVITEMFTPPMNLHVRCDQILGIHKVIGIQRGKEG